MSAMVLPGAYILIQKELLLLNAKIEPNFNMGEETRYGGKHLFCVLAHTCTNTD